MAPTASNWLLGITMRALPLPAPAPFCCFCCCCEVVEWRFRIHLRRKGHWMLLPPLRREPCAEKAGELASGGVPTQSCDEERSLERRLPTEVRTRMGVAMMPWDSIEAALVAALVRGLRGETVRAGEWAPLQLRLSPAEPVLSPNTGARVRMVSKSSWRGASPAAETPEAQEVSVKGAAVEEPARGDGVTLESEVLMLRVDRRNTLLAPRLKKVIALEASRLAEEVEGARLSAVVVVVSVVVVYCFVGCWCVLCVRWFSSIVSFIATKLLLLLLLLLQLFCCCWWWCCCWL